MTSIIEKRLSLHRSVAHQKKQSDILRSQLGQLEALANIGGATCMIAHEINNLLTPLANYATLALNNPDDRLLSEKALRKTVQNCERASKIMKSMLAVANAESNEKKSCQLIALVEEVFSCLCRDCTKDGITVKILISEDLTVWGFPIQIQQVLMNLIVNAREAILPKGGILTIKGQENADTVQIDVSDTGCGIKEPDLKKIFEMFFTTKTDKKPSSQKSGCGLGLAFCKKIIDEHNGSISVESQYGKGTTFKIILPKPRQGGQ